MPPLSFEYMPLRRVLLNADAAESLPALAAAAGANRALIMASGTLNRQTPAVSRIRDALADRCAGVFDGIGSHTPRQDVMAALDMAQSERADLLISVGGGSVIDAAKAVQFCMNGNILSEKQLLQYARFGDGSSGALAGRWEPDPARQQIRQIAVPTTLSGAEFSNNAGVTDTANGIKEGYRAPDLCAETIVYDPALSRHTPQWLWLSTAIRSLDHAIEGYCSQDAHAYIRAHFLHAMRLFADSLPATQAQNDNLQARSDNQQATWLACCALGKVRHGASHGIGYILGARCAVPHGHTSCVMLPAVLRWNHQSNAALQADIDRALGGTGDHPEGAGPRVQSLLESLGVPTRLRDVGVGRDALPDIAAAAAKHPVVRNNPRPIEHAGQVLEILELAW